MLFKPLMLYVVAYVYAFFPDTSFLSLSSLSFLYRKEEEKEEDPSAGFYWLAFCHSFFSFMYYVPPFKLLEHKER